MQRRRLVALVALSVVVLPVALSQFGAGCGTAVSGGGILFNLPPTPVIGSDVVRGVAPLTVNFNSDASSDDGLIVAREWDFGDGLTSDEISPSHTFTSTGDFTVTLALTDDLGSQSSQSMIISVTDAPVARIVVDRRSAESAPAVINFDGSNSVDPDGEIVEYRWDFGDGSREFLASVAHTYASSGSYRAKLTVTDNKGVTGTAEVMISIGIPAPEIEVRIPPAEVGNVVVSPQSPLWVQSIFDVEPGVPYMLRAGLDGDTDTCEAQTVVFDANSGATLFTALGHEDMVNAAAFSPDGDWLLTGGEDGTLRLLDAVTGELEQEFDMGTPVTALSFGPNGTVFAYGLSDGSVAVRGTTTGDLVRAFAGHAAAVNDVAFSPNGDQILSGANDRHAYLWELSSGDILRDFEHDLGVRAVAFSPADPTLVATGGADLTLRIWNVTSGAELVAVEAHGDFVNVVTFAPDGSVVLSGGEEGAARLWTIEGDLIQTFAVGDGIAIASATFSPDGLLVVTGSADGYGRVWDLVTGEQQFTLEPLAVYEEPGGRLAQSDERCTSAISAVGFSPDGLTVLTAVAAKNDIRLDTDPPNGNDLNLTYPAALSLEDVHDLDGEDVPVGRYYLWTEVRTDRSVPARDYADVTVNVVEPFTDEVDNSTPVVPFVNNRAAVVVAPTTDRQIFDLGPLARGDRIFLSLLTTPGYGVSYGAETFSVMVLDADQKVFTWYQDGYILFTPDTKLVIGHNSAHYYVVVDAGHGVNIRIDPDFGLTTRQQRIYLNFAGGTNISVAGEPPVTLLPFDANDLDPSFGADETEIVKNRIVEFARDRYGSWNIEITTSDEGDPPTPPYQTVYFGGTHLFLWGLADYIDPRNDTLTGSAIIYTDSTAGFYNTAEEYGAAIGEVAVHESAHVLGLRHVDNLQDIMMTGDEWQGLTIFTVSPLTWWEQYNSPAIGIQDAPQWFDELFGPS